MSDAPSTTLPATTVAPAPAAVSVPSPPTATVTLLTPAQLPPLPGLEVAGRGIFLRPYQPYTLAQIIFQRDQVRSIGSGETHAQYAIPVGYEVNDSPPFPMNESLNQVVIEESWDRFEKQMSMDASVAVGTGSFSVSASSSWNSRLRAEEDAYYAVRSSFVPLWMVYVPSPNDCIAAVRDPDIPVPFSHDNRAAYDDFFRCYGSHYVRGAWVGGKSMLVFTILKSSQMSKTDIQAGIKASFGQSSGGANARQDESRERLRQSSQCTVIGKGGDEVQLAAMSSLDQSAYNAWLKTIPDNPQVIELDVAGIWSLVRDPIKAVFDLGPDIYFIRGARFVRYERERKVAHPPRPLRELLPALEDDGFDRIDEAFRGKNLVSSKGDKLDNKLFVFRRDRVLRFDLGTRKKDPGFPMALSEAFPGVPFERVDAALVTGFDAIYFFYGNQYVRFNPQKNHVDEGYPQPISKRWVGVTFDRLDAAVYWGNGKVYFFKGDQHIRYDLANYRSDPGFPKHVVGNYVEDWKFIDG